MVRLDWLCELSEEIMDLEELLAKAEENNDLDGRWVTHLLRSLLERRLQALRNACLMDKTIH